MNNETQPTPEQLAQRREAFEKWFRMEAIARNISYHDAFDGFEAGYLRAQAGFNCALSDDTEALNKLIASRNGYLKPLTCGGAVKEST